jgi:hypothetical protein
MPVIPGVRATGAAALDAAAPKIAATLFDSMVALLSKPASDAAGGYLQSAMSAEVRNAGVVLPINLTNGNQCQFASAQPSVVADDADFAGADSLQFTATSSSITFAGLNPGQSWTFISVFTPHTSGAIGTLFLGNGGVNGARANLVAGGVQVWPQALGASVTLGSRAMIKEETANILVLSGDHVQRKVAMYLNSRTPILSAAVLPDPWPTLTNGQFGLGMWTAGGGQSNCRVANAAFCDKALHVAADGPRRIDDLIVAAAEQYGITLA